MLRHRTMPDCPVLPTLVYPDVAAAIDWLCGGLGLQERWRAGGDRAQLALVGAAPVLARGFARVLLGILAVGCRRPP